MARSFFAIFCSAVLPAMALAEVQADKRSTLESLKELGPTIVDYTLMRKAVWPQGETQLFLQGLLLLRRSSCGILLEGHA